MEINSIKINEAGKLEITLDKETKNAIAAARQSGTEAICVDYDSEDFEAHQEAQSRYATEAAWADVLGAAITSLVGADNFDLDYSEIQGLCGQAGIVTVPCIAAWVTVQGDKFNVTSLSRGRDSTFEI